MVWTDIVSLHQLLAVGGWVAVCAMAIHGLRLANLSRRQALGYVAVCAVLACLTLLDGAMESRDSRDIAAQQRRDNDTDRTQRDAAIKQLQSNLAQSLKNEDELKRQLSELKRPVAPGALPSRHTAVVPAAPKARADGAPPALAHITFTQEQVVSTDASRPFQLRVTVQTDTAIHNPDFLLTCDGHLAGGEFFVVGQGVMMNVKGGTLNVGCGFRFAFTFPDFTPEAPVAVMLSSDKPITVTGVRDLRGVAW